MDRRTFLKWASLGSTSPSLGQARISDYPLPGAPAPRPRQSVFMPNCDDDHGPKISLIACGGAGIAMARHIDKAAYGLFEIIALDTSRRALKSARNADRTLLIETDTGKKPHSPLWAWHWADERREAISTAIEQPHMAIILTGLGGSAGTAIADVASMQARSSGALTVALASCPLAFEGPIRQTTSLGGFRCLARSCNPCTLPLQVIAEHLGPEATFDTVFRYVREAVHHFLWNTSGRLSRQGLVGLDFEDIRTVLEPGELRGYSSSSIGWGDASGKDRAMEAARQAASHPMLLARSELPVYGVSVSIRAHQKNLKMKDINTVMALVKKHICDFDTHVIFSGEYDDTLDDRMQVSIILHRRWDSERPS